LSRHLTDEDVEAICTRLAEFSGLSPEEHRDHHSAFASFMAAQKRKADFRDKMQEQIGGWFILGVLSGLAFAAWKGFMFIVGKGS
jgi:hypothetical protein